MRCPGALHDGNLGQTWSYERWPQIPNGLSPVEDQTSHKHLLEGIEATVLATQLTCKTSRVIDTVMMNVRCMEPRSE